MDLEDAVRHRPHAVRRIGRRAVVRHAGARADAAPTPPARGFHFQYDAAGRWVGMTNTVAAGGQTSPYTLSIAYDEDDQVDAMTWAGSDHRLALYDTLDVPGGGPTSTRDALGRPTRETSWEARAQPLAYDGLGQLVLKGTEWLQYDTAGAGQLVHGYRTGTSTYNALGQLAENDNADSVRYAYDAQGNRVSEDYAQQGFDGRPEVQYAYDGANHMISRRKQATPGDSSVVASAYWYDALGRRVIASDSTTDASGFVQRYYYDAAGPNAGDVAFVQDNIQTAPDEFRPSIRATAATMSLGGSMGPNHVLLRFPDAGYAVSNGVPLHEVFEHQNRQFTTYGESAPDGTPQGVTPEYGAFGTPGQGAGTQASGYTGAPTGSGGLVFLRNRYYDPNTGSFTQEDPIGLAGGMNRYQYAGNDPVNFSDPFGLCPCPPDNDCDTPAGALGGDRFGGGGAGRSWGDRDGHAEAAAPKGPGELDKLANVVALAETNDYRASELRAAALDAGWKEYQKNPTGPLFYRDKNGVDRLVLKKGSPRAPGSEGPHAEFRDASGKRVDARGRRVTRNYPRNHTPIVWDLPNQQR